MTAGMLIRLSGGVLILSAVTMVVGRVLHPLSHAPVYQTAAVWGPAHLLLFLSYFLTLVGLPGMYAAVAGRLGVIGLVGFGLTMVAVTGALINQYFEALVVPMLAAGAATQTLTAEGGPLQYAPFGAFGPVRGPLTVAGYALLGGVMEWAGVPRRGAGALIVVGALIYLASALGEWVFHVAGVATQAGFGWLGLELWRRSSPPAPPPLRALPTVVPQGEGRQEAGRGVGS